MSDDVNRSIPVTRVLPTVNNRRPREQCRQRRDDAVLLQDVVDNESTAGDILDLCEADALTPELFDDRTGRFCGSARWLQLQLCADGSNNSCVGPSEGTAIVIQQSDVILAEGASPQAVTEPVNLCVAELCCHA